MKIIRESSLPCFSGISFSDAFTIKESQISEPVDRSTVKWSKYNIWEPLEDDVIVYNTASDGIVIFGKAELNKIFEYDNIEEWVGSQDIIDLLARVGVLISKNTDEDLLLSMVRQNQIMHPDKELKIAINTTYGCNARCDYCFECDADHSKMTYEVADQVADYICKAIDETTLLTYRWFGGEPLLAADIIDRIITRVNTYYNNKINYRSVILSNGTIYNAEIFNKMFNEWKVYEFHVTLDGDRDIHNRKKNFVDKNLDGYSRVMDLVQELLKHDIIVACRINVDKNNISRIGKIVEAFDTFANKELLNVYAAPTRRHTKESEKYCFDYSEYEQVFDAIFSVLNAHGLLASPDRLVPQRKVTCCSTRAINELVIDTNGSFFKCMQTSTSDQKCIGNCSDGLIMNDELSQWLIPNTPQECVGCKYMPICQGGCKGFRSLNNPLVSPCVIEKHFMKTILKYVYFMSKEERK